MIATRPLAASEHRRGHRSEVGLTLAHRLGDPALADHRQLADQSVGVGDRPFCVGGQLSPRESATSPPNASMNLPGGGGIRDTLRRPRRAMLTTLDGAGTKSTVIAAPAPGTDRVAVSARLVDQRQQPRPGPLAHVEPGKHAVRQGDELQPQPIGAAGRPFHEGAPARASPKAATRCSR